MTSISSITVKTVNMNPVQELTPGRREMDSIGKMILFHRQKSGLSRIRLAEISGVSKTVIYDIEHGKFTRRPAIRIPAKDNEDRSKRFI